MRDGADRGDAAGAVRSGDPKRHHGRCPVALWPYGLVFAWYLLISVLTRSSFKGDTFVYAADIVKGGAGIWEFGHLMWRPLGVAAYAVLGPLARAMVGADRLTSVTFVLEMMGWAFGLGAALAMLWLLLRTCRDTRVAVIGAAAFVGTHVVIQYAPSGTAYIAGLFFLLVGMALLMGMPDRPASALEAAGAGVALGVAVLIWLPHILAIPAALALPVLVGGRANGRGRILWQPVASLGALVLLAYGITGLGLGLRSPAMWRAWSASANHGITNNKGVSQMVLGFPRSLIDMGGGDGALFRRFAVHDPLNPIGLRELLLTLILHVSTWKFVLFYASLAVVAFTLATRRSERGYLGLMAVGFVPVLAFAVVWQGGDLERYVGLFPILFVCCGRAALAARVPRVLLAALMLVGLGSTFAYGNRILVNRQEAAVTSRLVAVEVAARPGSVAFITHPQPEFEDIAGRFPRNPYSLHPQTKIRALVSIGTSDLPRWRETAAAAMLQTWNSGGDVYLSTWALRSRPDASWMWVEGADPRVKWRDIYDFGRQLELGRQVGGDVSFVVVPPSAANRRLLQRLAGAGG